MSVVYQRENVKEKNDEIGHLCDGRSRMIALLSRWCWWVIFVTIEQRRRNKNSMCGCYPRVKNESCWFFMVLAIDYASKQFIQSSYWLSFPLLKLYCLSCMFLCQSNWLYNQHLMSQSFLPYLREVQKCRVMYSHRYSLFMDVTSIFTVFMMSAAFLFSFIVLYRKQKRKAHFLSVAILSHVYLNKYSTTNILASFPIIYSRSFTWLAGCLRDLCWRCFPPPPSLDSSCKRPGPPPATHCSRPLDLCRNVGIPVKRV